MKLRPRALLLAGGTLASAAAVAACTSLLGDFSVSAGQDGGTADASPDGTVSSGDGSPGDAAVDGSTTYAIVKPSAFKVVRGTTATLNVDVTRTAFDADITLTLTNLPNGVSFVNPAAATVVLSQGKTHASFDLTAPANAPLASSSAEVVATTSSQLNKTVTFPFLVADPPGTLDLTFGGNGVKSVAAASFDAVTVEGDGSVVVAGSAQGGGQILLRYKVDGTEDTTYNTAVAASLLGAPARLLGVAERVLVPANPEIVAVGFDGASRMFVLVFNHDGTLDKTFNGTGIYQVPAGSSQANAVAVDGQQRIVVVGQNSTGPAANGRRFETTGQSTFFTIPALPAAYTGFTSKALAVTIGANDDVWIAGTIFSPTAENHAFLAHLDSALKPDMSFGSGGIAIMGAFTDGWSVGRFANGTVGVGGDISGAAVRDFLGLFSTTGQPLIDNDAGGLTIAHGTPYDFGYHGAAMALDDRVVLAGGRGSNTKEHPFYERRFADGGLDPAVDGGSPQDGGVVDFLNGGPTQSASEWRAAAITPGGRYVLCGVDDSGGILARYWP